MKAQHPTASYSSPRPAGKKRASGCISIAALGMSLGTFIATTFALCVLFDALFPNWAMYPVWQRLFPGFTWFTWPGFLLGLAESFAYGWYAAAVFAPLYNYFAARSARDSVAASPETTN